MYAEFYIEKVFMEKSPLRGSVALRQLKFTHKKGS